MKRSHKKLLMILAISLSLSLSSCAEKPPTDISSGASAEVTDETVSDRGQEFIDSFIFFGESTTYHLKSRGVLSGGKNTKQVLGPTSGTLCLDGVTADTEVLYGESSLPFCRVLKNERPQRLLLCFGLNGALRNSSGDGLYFKSCYKKLIETAREASPDTEIYLQSCYPVAANMDTSAFGCSTEELNGHIDKINGYTEELARELGLIYVNTSPLLTDSHGYLAAELQSGDGYHLTAEAYIKVLEYLRFGRYK